MININQYIIEKLKINKDTKVKQEYQTEDPIVKFFLEILFDFLGKEPNFSEPTKIMEKWVKEHNIVSFNKLSSYVNESGLNYFSKRIQSKLNTLFDSDVKSYIDDNVSTIRSFSLHNQEAKKLIIYTFEEVISFKINLKSNKEIILFFMKEDR